MLLSIMSVYNQFTVFYFNFKFLQKELLKNLFNHNKPEQLFV